MSFQTKLTLLCFAAGMAVTQISLAEMVQLEQSSAITLSSLTQKVYEQHPSLNNEQAHKQQVNANKELANSRFAGAKSISFNHQNDVLGSGDGLQEWEASIDMPLWLPKQKQHQLNLSNQLSAELPAYKQYIRLQASETVRELIWNIVLANNEMKQAHQVWQTAQKLEQDVVARVKAGDLAGSEHLLVSTNVLEMHSLYLLAQAELEHALESYHLFTGETALPVNFDEELDETLIRNSKHHQAKVDQQHPLLAMLERQVNTLRSQQDLAYYAGAINPTLSVGVKRDRGDNHERFNNSIGLGISFALDNGGYQRPAIADAARSLADAEIEHQHAQRMLNSALFSSLHDLDTMQNQLTLVSEQNIATQHYLELQQRAFDLGEIDLVSLLRSQALSNKASNRKQTLEINIKKMIANVNQSLGILL